MKKQLITVLSAIVVLAALAGVYFWNQNRLNSATAEEETPPAATETIKLVEREKMELNSVIFVSGDSEMTFNAVKDIEKNKIEWQIEGYEDIKVNTSTMDSMVTPVYYLSPYERIADTDDNLAEYGLAEPAVVATGTYTDGSTVSVYIGKQTPAKDYYYTKVEGTPGVYLMYSITGDRFFNTVYDLVSKDVPALNIESLTYAHMIQKNYLELEFAYVGSDDAMKKELESYGMVSLSMTKPYPGRDLYYSNFQEMVLANIQSLSFTGVAEIYPEDLSVYGLDDPELTMYFEDDDEENVFNLIVGGSADEGSYYVMVPGRPIVYTATKTSIAPFLNLNVFKFIDKFVALMNIANVDELYISSAERGREHTIILNHEIIPAEKEDGYDEDILHPEIDGESYEEDSFKKFYTAVIGLTYDTEVIDASISGEPLLTIRYVMNNGEPDVVTQYYRYNDDFYAVKRDDYPVQFVVNKQSVNNMFGTMDRLLRGETLK